MKVFKHKFFAIILSAFCFSCSGEAYHEELNGGYYLSAIDAKEDMVLGYQDGVIGGGVGGYYDGQKGGDFGKGVVDYYHGR